jgi:hypothetical protein
MTKYVVTNAEAVEKIKNEEMFRNRTVPDANGMPAWWGYAGLAGVVGYLPAEYWKDARRARYVVYSYATPIAWVRKDGTKVIPDVGYSPTTGQHQMFVQYAWDMREYPRRGRQVVRPDATHAQYGRERRLRRGGVDGHGPLLTELVDESPDAARWTP